MKPIPSPQQLQNYNVNVAGNVEGIRQPLYDFFYSGAATTTGTQISFFQAPIGQGVGSGGNAKTLEDTNMNSAGQLPTPKMFLVESVSVQYLPNIALSRSSATSAVDTYTNEIQKLYEKGYLEIFIGSKPYLDIAPLGRFPFPNYVYGWNSIGGIDPADNLVIYDSYATAAGKPFSMEPPILLIPNQNFTVTLNWPNGAVTGLVAGFRIGLHMDGILYRNSQ